MYRGVRLSHAGSICKHSHRSCVCADFPWLSSPKMLNKLYLDTMRNSGDSSDGSGISSSPLRYVLLCIAMTAVLQ